MPTSTYILLASTVLTGTSSTVTFSSISGSYQDLVLVSDIITSTSAVNCGVRLNGNTDSSYSALNMRADTFGTGSSLTTQTEFRLSQRGDGQPNTTRRAFYVTHIFEYAQAKGKPILSTTGTSSCIEAQSGRWANTSTVTSVSVVALSDSFAATSRFYLYGVVA